MNQMSTFRREHEDRHGRKIKNANFSRTQLNGIKSKF